MNSTTPPKPRRRLYGLLAVNGALLLALAAVTFSPVAEAQSLARGEYTMVAGSVNGSQSGVVYIVDVVNQEMIAITFEHSQKELLGIGYRNLRADVASLARGQSR